MEAFKSAAQNRSIRTIRTELDFLLDSSLLSSSQVSQILAILPSTPSSTATPTSNGIHATSTSKAEPTSTAHQTVTAQSSSNPWSNSHSQQPPVSPASVVKPAAGAGVATANALYAYAPADAGDLALQPQDRVTILENMNADWARGRNERTGEEGIFPRSYVHVIDEKGGTNGSGPMLPYRANSASGYGNMPVEVANGQQQQQPGGDPAQPNKFNEHGKKFGKKLGNAAVFGAGATIGSNLVNSIF